MGGRWCKGKVNKVIFPCLQLLLKVNTVFLSCSNKISATKQKGGLRCDLNSIMGK